MLSLFFLFFILVARRLSFINKRTSIMLSSLIVFFTVVSIVFVKNIDISIDNKLDMYQTYKEESFPNIENLREQKYSDTILTKVLDFGQIIESSIMELEKDKIDLTKWKILVYFNLF